MTRALLITNPFAARADARAVTAILKILGRGGWNVDLRTIKGPGDARRIAEESRDEGFDVMVSHGGDGTAMQVAAAIAGSGIALGVVPGGTGNVLAGNLRLPRTSTAAARALLTARARRDDTSLSAQRTAPRDRGWHSPGNPRRHAAGVELWPAAAGLSQAARRS